MIGREIYHQNFSYFAASPSIIGKLITAEIIIIMTINCLINNFMRYPFAMINTPTKKHKAKKTYNQISPNATLAYVLKNINTGDPSAKYS